MKTTFQGIAAVAYVATALVFHYHVRVRAMNSGYCMTNSGSYYTFSGNAAMTSRAGFPVAAYQYRPVSNLSWRSAIVWCNAYSEMTGATPCYYSDATFTTPIRSDSSGAHYSSINSAAGSFDAPYVKWEADGYKLPSEGEWQYAASDGGAKAYDCVAGDTTNNYEYSTIVGNYAQCYSNCVNGQNQMNDEYGMKKVGLKLPNAFGLYDMSGNIGEWCFDWYSSTSPTAAQA